MSVRGKALEVVHEARNALVPVRVRASRSIADPELRDHALRAVERVLAAVAELADELDGGGGRPASVIYDTVCGDVSATSVPIVAELPPGRLLRDDAARCWRYEPL